MRKREGLWIIRLTSPLLLPLGTAFGGFKSRRDIPMLVDKCMSGELPVDHFITHNFEGVGATNEAIDALHSGKCLRAVVKHF